jgi:hypothetical protein
MFPIALIANKKKREKTSQKREIAAPLLRHALPFRVRWLPAGPFWRRFVSFGVLHAVVEPQLCCAKNK